MSHKFLNIDWDLFDKRSAESKEKLKQLMQNDNYQKPLIQNDNYQKPLTYFIPPPVIQSSISYQDVNKDNRLRETVTNFFLRKTIKWITNYTEFKNNKNLLNILKTDVGHELIYNILRQFVKKNNCNWYELRNNYILVKDFIRHKLKKH
jgi:hypothetical protein